MKPSQEVVYTFLEKSNDQLLADFKWGSEGENAFHHFLNAVRDLRCRQTVDQIYSQVPSKVQEFISEYGISCGEAIHQRDVVMENALPLIEDLYDLMQECRQQVNQLHLEKWDEK